MMRRFSGLFLVGSAVAGAALAAQGPLNQPTVRVVDGQRKQPIPYASVGVAGRPLGTVADAQGGFVLARVGAADTDTVVVSCVGYQSRRLLVADLSKLPELALTPQAAALQEVQVHADTWKRRNVGREGSGGFTFYNFHLQADKEPANKLGREVGAILGMKPNSFVEEAYVYIRQRSFRHLRFRLNVRALDSQDHPAASLLTQDVQFAVADSTASWQHLDLKPYNINVGPQSRIAVTLEWLDGTPTKQQDWYSVSIPAALSATHRMVFRDKSEDQWKVQPINLSLYITTVSPD
ncbi:carboxypeptidase-like regulatory domain-containing protein [Hymenobacter setariae]|uniref:Carboxypeptidase-like regulatory domain-containing protein n=1 Tax=Hymenobacter setariae TaxID=2594794 RepID=A0A558C2B1_9BACT|nr:carboxypeptidase-like regulatory domain-containing protein [Hymenobacter setariae]TVT42923.1 carboxypeptidase-like regulatory domain-containing protein [Hymenobacter setariae]